ncbi:MAG TPA: TIGR02206 family membrane protein, partial [Burkholderiales bacterium]|nr:TIGR02206 family membrane protein [Burkholderiales bacterium]
FLLFPPLHEPAKTYPLQLCHLNALAAALLLITRWATLRPLVYFWGFALSTQALITPSLTEGPAIYPFWFFWSTHGIIVGVALYEVFARGYRPTTRDYGIACAAAALYVAIVLPLDLAFDWNYGFVGRGKPEVRSIVDALGPWPERLAIIVPLVAAVMASLLLPWKIVSRS